MTLQPIFIQYIFGLVAVHKTLEALKTVSRNNKRHRLTFIFVSSEYSMAVSFHTPAYFTDQ